jgi:uncharacterized repeat protein (TIGR01451 family)
VRQTRRGRWWIGAGRRVTVAALLALAAVLGLAAPAMAADTDLQLSIVDRDPVQLGNTLVYTITVKNAGSAADDATVRFTMPSGTTFGSATVNRANCPAPAGGTVTCPIGTLAAGASRAVVVNLEPQAVGTVSFTASVTGTGTDPDTANNSETETTTVSVRPTDLAVTMSAPATAAAGGSIAYTATVTNNAVVAADAVTVVLTVPAGGSFVSASAACGAPGPAVSCNLGTIPAGGTATVTLTVTAGAPGQYASTATVSGSAPDPAGANNSATATTKVAGPPTDIAISIAGAPNPALEGGTVTYTITVANQGPNAADGVALTAVLPDKMTFEAAAADAGTCTPGSSTPVTVDCTLGSIPAGGSLGVTVKANASTTGDFAVSATVDSAAVDTNSANNGASTTTTVVPRVADLAVVINDPGPILVNDSFTLVLNISNPSVAPADGVILDIALPSGVTLLGVTTNGACTPIGSTLTCVLGRLNGGSSRGLQLRLRAGAAGPLAWSARVSSTTTDPNPANNAASASVAIVTELPPPPGDGGTGGGGGGGGTTPPPATALKLTAALDGSSARLSRGIPVALTVTAKATVRLALSAKVRGKTRRLGSWRKGFSAAGEDSVRLKLSRAARRTVGRLRTGSALTLTVTATGDDGKATTKRVRLKVVRGGRLKKG